MDSIENKPTNNYREQIVEQMKSRFPDRNFDSPDGQNSLDSISNLEKSILDALSEDGDKITSYAAKQQEYDQSADKLTALFNNSKRSALFLSILAETGNPAVALYKAYGREAMDALENDDTASLISKIEEEDAKAKAEDEQFEAEKEANLKESFINLDEWGNEHGLTEDEKVNVFMRFYNILQDAMNGIYSRELFEMGWKSDHYSEDVDTARHEGEVNGRNAKIQEMTRRRQDVQSMPPSLNGQGGREPEIAPSPKDDPWMLRGRRK